MARPQITWKCHYGETGTGPAKHGNHCSQCISAQHGCGRHLMPVVVSRRRRNISPSRLLLPVSYLAIFGGVCTLIGTSTTLVVNGELQQRVQEGLLTAGDKSAELFELAAIGVPCALIGSTFLLTLGPKLLPFRSGIIKQLDEQRRECLPG